MDFLTPYLFIGGVHTVDLGVERKTEVVVVHAVEAPNGIALYDLLNGIPTLLDAVGVPAFGVVERRGDIDVAQDVERGGYRDGVTHTVAPILDEVGVEQLIFLSGDTV